MAVEKLALQPYSTGPDTAMIPRSLTPGQPDQLPLCTPATNVPNVVSTHVPPTLLDHDIVMTPRAPGYLPLSTPIVDVSNAVPTSVTPKPSLETRLSSQIFLPGHDHNAMPASVFPQLWLQPGQDGSNTMELGPDSPTPPSCSTSLNFPPIPGRPLQIPESFESVIQRTVMERLTLNSAEFIHATVSGVVDACVPRLVELIDAKITSLVSDRTKGSRTCGGSGNDGWEGDNEDKSLSPKARRKPGPRGHMNYLHVWFIPKPAHQ